MKKKITALAAALAVCAAALPAAFSVSAAPALYSVDQDASEMTTQFDKYLVLDIGANVPNAAFSFTAARYDAEKAERAVLIPADTETGTLAVLNGIDGVKFTSGADAEALTGSQTAGEVKFVPGDTAVTEAEADENVSVYWETAATDDEKYVKKTLTLDFSGAAFDEPGVYRYLIAETEGTEMGIAYDDGLTGDPRLYRTLDVYVEDQPSEDEAEHKLAVTGYVLYIGKFGEAPKAAGGDDNAIIKSDSYTNSYASYELTFAKEVTGNQGSKDKYFAFTVTLEGAVPGTVYDVSYADDRIAATQDGSADPEIEANPNSATTVITENVTQPAQLTADDFGKAEAVFYLRHGQSIVIRGLAEGTKYTVAENKEDYTPAYTTDDADDKTAQKLDTAQNAEGIGQDVAITFTNERKGTIPTGIFLAVGAPVAVGLVTAGAIVFLSIRSRKRDDEEED